MSPESNIKTRLPAKMKAEKIDDFTVDFVLAVPNPILHAEWDSWYIMSKSWAEANGATKVQPNGSNLSPFALKANGTGPFMVDSHQPGVRTVFKPNPKWWGKPEHNLTEVIFQTIKADATRVAALLSGEVDMIDPVPVQDIPRVKANAGTDVLAGPELRTIFLNMDQFRDELLYSDVKGKNPFKDVRVRKAFYQAIDVEAIKARIMRGNAVPSALLIYPPLFSRSAEFKRHPYDPEAAKKLLADAGYPNGFARGDGLPQRPLRQRRGDLPGRRRHAGPHRRQGEAQRHAEGAILREGGAPPEVRQLLQSARLDAQARSTASTSCVSIAGCRDANGKGATFNYGGYCNPVIDELAGSITTENDIKKRDDMIAKAFRIIHEDVGLIPLHQQTLNWGVSKKVSMVQRADNRILFYWVRMN